MIDPGRVIGSHCPERDRHILRLFIREIDKDIALLCKAQSHESWVRAAHGLKNSAAGVAADHLLAAARAAELIDEARWDDGRDVVEADLIGSAQRARDEALRLL